jgi:hypothetical protein
MSMIDTMTFEENGGQTSVNYTAEFKPEGAARLIEPLMPLGLKKLGDDAAESMRRELERLV